MNGMEGNTIENRKMERFSLELAAQLAVAGSEKEAALKMNTCDVCAGGAFFHTQQSIPLGTEVTVDLILPLERFREIKTDKALIEVSGKVIRTEKNGMAVCFNRKYRISPITD